MGLRFMCMLNSFRIHAPLSVNSAIIVAFPKIPVLALHMWHLY